MTLRDDMANLEVYNDSEFDGRPAVFILFEYGTRTIAYTSGEKEIEIGGTKYLPVPMTHESIRAGADLDRSDIKISLPHDCEVARLFDPIPPTVDINVTIFQGQEGTITMERQFIGIVKGLKIIDRVAEISCETIAASISRVGLRRHWTLGCDKALYGDECSADRSAHTFDVQVIETSRYHPRFSGSLDSITFDIPENNTVEMFLGGIVEWESPRGPESRTIIRSEIDAYGRMVAVLNAPHGGIDVGSTVRVSRGCPHTMEACRDIFANILNFGGEPWIPLENPVHQSFMT